MATNVCRYKALDTWKAGQEGFAVHSEYFIVSCDIICIMSDISVAYCIVYITAQCASGI